MHEPDLSFSRRQFLGYGAVASLGSILAGSQDAAAAEPASSPPVTPPAAAPPPAVPSKSNPALPLVRRLADKFLSWQIDLGRLDPDRTSAATWTHARCSYPCITIILNKLYRVTGELAYRQAADRFALFFLAALCNTWKWHPPHFGLGLVMYHQLKQNYPKSPDLDPRAAALFKWLADFHWDEGSYYRNWLVATVPKTDLDSPSAGYFPVHGKSLPKPPDCVAWLLAWAMEGLLHVEEI
jgi:hypothetical protein